MPITEEELDRWALDAVETPISEPHAGRIIALIDTIRLYQSEMKRIQTAVANVQRPHASLVVQRLEEDQHDR